MATITFNGESYTVDRAVKGTDYVHGYDADGGLVVSIDGVVDFNSITYSGSYLDPTSCAEENGNYAVYVSGALKTRSGTTVPQPGTDYGTARVRNISAGTTDMTAGTTELASGDIYIVYE